MAPMISNTSRARAVAESAVLAAAICLAVLSCSDNTSVKHGPPAMFTMVSGDAQFGVIKTELPRAFIVKVTDADTVPIQGVTITWALAGLGALDAPTSTTDRTGQAKVTLTFGATAGTTTVTSTAAGLSNKIIFNATAAAPGVRDDWVTYGHDGTRAGASQASIKGPLTKLWSYTPSAPSGTRPFQYVLNALAAADGIYLQWSAQSVLGSGYTGATDVDRVNTNGTRAWTFDGGYDTNIGQWGSLWGNRFVFQDDGIGYLNTSNGARLWFSGVDRWGETLADTSGLYVDHRWHVDGPGPFVARMQASGARTWIANNYGTARGDGYDDIAGIALSGSTLFVAADYWAAATVTNPPLPGVYALSKAAGARLAFAGTKPSSKISADATQVYLIENNNQLVARAQSDLHIVWSIAVTSPGQQAPVLANRAVIIATSSGVESHNAATGALLWRSPTINGLNSYIGSIGGPTTTLAAALGSGTLIATSNSDGIHVLQLTNGHELSHYVLSYSNAVWDPVIVNDSTRGGLLYAVSRTGLVAFSSP
jgi:hypothetical protein